MSTNIFNPADRRVYPDRWPMHRGKQLFRIIDERSEEGKEELLSVSHITGITPRSQKNVTMFQAESLVGYKKCQVGDIAANTMWTWQGAIGVSAYAGVVSPAYNVYRQNGDYYNPRFLDMLLRERKLVDVYHSISTGIRPSRLRLYPDEFLTIRFPVPAKDEQDQIVRYLDWKLSNLNRLINIKREQIALLMQLKQDRIKKQVLFGLSEQYDLQESGVDWIKAIPDYWEMKPLKRLFRIVSGATPKSGEPTYWNGEISWVTPADYKTEDKYITKTTRHITDEGFKACSTNMIPQNSIIISKRAPVGTVAINQIDLCTSQGCLSCIPYDGVSVLYYYYLFSVFREVFDIHSAGTTFKEISATAFGNLKFPFPPTTEQMEIATKIDNSCKDIEIAIDCKKQQIRCLENLKMRMISDAITGRIDVRRIEIPDYEYCADENKDASDEETDEGDAEELEE